MSALPPSVAAFLRTPGRQAWWAVSGLYYGYPKCCVDYFVENAGNGWNSDQDKAANCSGFIPCPVCAARVVSGEVTLKQLIVGRKCTAKFPRDLKCDQERIERLADYLLQSHEEAAE